MGIQKTVFVADDGTEFDTEAEMTEYEASLGVLLDLDKYVKVYGISKQAAGMLRKQVPQFLAWMHAGKPDEPLGAEEDGDASET